MDENHRLLIHLQFLDHSIERQFILLLGGLRFVLDRDADETLSQGHGTERVIAVEQSLSWLQVDMKEFGDIHVVGQRCRKTDKSNKLLC